MDVARSSRVSAQYPWGRWFAVLSAVGTALVVDVLLYNSRGSYVGGGDCGGKSCIAEHDNLPLVIAGIALLAILLVLICLPIAARLRR